MADNVIQSFLVKLGFQVDQASSKNFNDSIKNGMSSIKEFKLGLLALAAGVEEAVRRTMRTFDAMYVTSRLTGVPAKALADMQFAFKGIGLSAEAANSTLSSLAGTLRDPGYRGAITALVGPTKNAAEAFELLAQKYSQTMEAAGGDEASSGVRSLIATMENIPGVNVESVRHVALFWREYKDGLEDNRKIAAAFRFNEKEASTAAFQLQRTWNVFTQTISTAIARFVTDNFDKIKFILDELGKWLRSDAVTKGFEKVLDFIKRLFDDEKPKQWSEAVKIATAAWDALVWIITKAYEGFKLLEQTLQNLGVEHSTEWAAGIVAALVLIGPTIVASITTALLGLAWRKLFSSAVPAAASAGAAAGTRFGSRFRAAGAIGIAGLLYDLWKDQKESGLGTKRYDAEKDKKEGGYLGRSGVISPEMRKEGKGILEEGATFGDTGVGQLLKQLGLYQHGGIVPAGLHAGEMVLPTNISFGLQQLFSRPSIFGGGGGNELLFEFKRWWSGEAAFRPLVDLAAGVYDKLEALLLDVWDAALKAMGHKEGIWGATGEGGSAAGGGGGAGGGPGRRSRDGSGGAPGSNEYSGQGSEFLKNQRARMAEEIKNTPGLEDELLGMARLEDARDPAGPLEALANRAAYTGKTLKALLHSGFYGPINRGQLPGAIAALTRDPKAREKLKKGLDFVLEGSNRLKGATDQGTAGDPNAKQTSGRIMPPGGTPSAIYVDWGGGPGGVGGAARWREAQQRHVAGEVKTETSTATPSTSPTRSVTTTPARYTGPATEKGKDIGLGLNSKGETIVNSYGQTAEEAAKSEYESQMRANKARIEMGQKERPLTGHAKNWTPETAPGAGAPGASMSVTPTSAKDIDAVLGDSIAFGVAQQLKLAGTQFDTSVQGKEKAFGPSVDAISGTTPEQIYNRLQGHIKDFTGKTVALMSGSNPAGPLSGQQMDYVRKTVKALQDAGAKVVLGGVGYGTTEARKRQKALEDVAKSMGIPITEMLEGTERRGGVVHPDSYKRTVDQLKRAIQSAREHHAEIQESKGSMTRSMASKASDAKGGKLEDYSTVVVNVYGDHDPSKTAEHVQHAAYRHKKERQTAGLRNFRVMTT